jgi:hypothetical protein
MGFKKTLASLIASGALAIGVGGLISKTLADGEISSPNTYVYSVDPNFINEHKDDEYRVRYKNKHFLTFIQNSDTKAFVIRPGPGDDKNRWGSTLYFSPFSQYSQPGEAKIEKIIADSNGVNVDVFGAIPKGKNYGGWAASLTFTYDPNEKQIKGTGTYSISLGEGYRVNNEDLNLFRIASNYLEDVKLLNGKTGDTGDMEKVEYRYGWDVDFPTITPDGEEEPETPAHVWIPDSLNPGHFPTDESYRLFVNVIGNLNNVDANSLGFKPIQPAYKPNLGVELISHNTRDDGISFGAWYSYFLNQDPFAYNVGITPLILKPIKTLNYVFDVNFTSTALLEDGTDPNQDGMTNEVLNKAWLRMSKVLFVNFSTNNIVIN